MKIDISDIVKRDGALKEVVFNGSLDDLQDLADITIDAPVSLNAQLINEKGIIKLEGTLKTHYTGICHKCLKIAGADMDLNISESIVNSETNSDIEVYTYEGRLIDLGKIIRDNIILNLPMRLLCEETCRGICPVCGTDMNVKDCDCSKEDTNLQMEMLKNFFSN